jgi:aspartyl-tRNA(Asn)/glutamyl-tRNA(Gln) amidotransferase subunit C
MPLSKDTIEYVSHLARIELDAQELKEFSVQLEEIVNFIDTLKRIDIKDIPPTSHILPVNNIAREDKNRDSLPADKALLNAPQRKESFFGVPKVIE